MITVVFLFFIDPDECNKVLENKSEDNEIMDADLGESAWWDEDGGGDPVTAA